MAVTRAYALARQVPHVDYRDDIGRDLVLPSRYAAVNAQPLKAVAFDLDGTVTDSLHACVVALQEALAAIDVTAPLEVLRPTVGLPLVTSVPLLLAELGAADVNVRDVIAAYEVCYPRVSRKHTVVVDGFKAVLGELSQSFPLAIVTSKATSTALDVLEHSDLGSLFCVVVGSDRTSALKPDPAPLLEACRMLGVSPESTALVGDATVDMQMARAAGALAIGVDWGAANLADLLDAGASEVVSDLATLREILSH